MMLGFEWRWRTLQPVLGVGLSAWLATACGLDASHAAASPDIRYVRAADAKPYGDAANAHARLIASAPDGTKTYALILGKGDEVVTAVTRFAKLEKIGNAHLQAIGAVREPEIAWFDFERSAYKALRFHAQMEVLTLSGDVTEASNGEPAVHMHVALGDAEGHAFGGHLLNAITSPTLEVYVTSYPEPLHKRVEPALGLELIDLTQK